MNADQPEPVTAPGTAAAVPAAWQCFFRGVSESLELHHAFTPMPAFEDSGDATVRVMQRGRRHAWLHARYQLHWSMFESIRISVLLADAFGEWTHGGASDMSALARRLEEVEHEARHPAPVSDELRFVDHLLSVATVTDLHLADLEMAMEAYRTSDGRRRSSGKTGGVDRDTSTPRAPPVDGRLEEAPGPCLGPGASSSVASE